MNGTNLAIIDGYIKNATIQKINATTSKANVLIACKTTSKTQDNIPCEIWRKSDKMEILKPLLLIGNRIRVIGKIKTDSYEANGKKNYRTYLKEDRSEIEPSTTEDYDSEPDMIDLITDDDFITNEDI